MIEIIQGTPGSGKSAVALVLGLSHLADGGALACNFDLVPDWAWFLAGLNHRVRLGMADRLQRAQNLRNRCFRIGTAKTIFDLSARLDSCGLSEKVRNQREGKGLLILDEAQLVFNSRQWSDNKIWIEFFTQHRKLGWNVLLIAHHLQMIDKQIRPLIEIETRFRNLKNITIPFLPIRLSPVNAFLAVRFYAGHGPGSGMVHGRSLHFLDLNLARLYDTLRVFAFDDLQATIENQGRNPAVSAEMHPDYLPDYFMGKKAALLLKKIKGPVKSSSKLVRKKPPFVPAKPAPGQYRDFY